MGTRPDRGLGDGPQRVSDEELKDGVSERRGGGAGGGCVSFWEAGAAGLGGRRLVSLVHIGARVVYLKTLQQGQRRAPCLSGSTRRAPPAGMQGPCCASALGVLVPPISAPPSSPRQQVREGGSPLVAAPSVALGTGWGTAGCPAAGHWIREPCVATWPPTPAPRRDTCPQPQPSVPGPLAPPSPVAVTSQLSIPTAPAQGALTSGTPGALGAACELRAGRARPQLPVPLPSGELQGLLLGPCGQRHRASRL